MHSLPNSFTPAKIGRSPSILFLQFYDLQFLPTIVHAVKYWSREGASITAVAIKEPRSECPDYADVRYVKVDRLPLSFRVPISFAQFMLTAIWLMATKRPQLVHASDLLSCPAALCAMILFRIPVVYQEHDSPMSLPGLRRMVLTRLRDLLASRAKQVLVPNRGRGEAFRGLVSADRLFIAPNFPPLPEVLSYQGSISARGEELRIYYHGSINPSRLPLSVIHAIAQSKVPMRLLIAGYDTTPGQRHTQVINQLARSLKVDSKVNFLEYVPSRSSLLAIGATCHVGLSLMPMDSIDVNEMYMAGASQKFYEYLMIGLVPLVSVAPDWVETFRGHDIAIWCDPSDPETIKCALEEIAANPERRSELVRRGQGLLESSWHSEQNMVRLRTRIQI